MNRAVNLSKRVNTSKGPRFCAPVYSANGRIKPDWVTVDGNRENHPEGCYYISWYEGSNRIHKSVGKVAADAFSRQQRKEAELAAVANGVTVIPENSGRKTVASAIDAYLEEVELSKKPKTYAAYSRALELLRRSCRKLYLDEIDRTDMLRFAAYMRDDCELSARTVSNNWGHVLVALKAMGREKVTRKGDWPRYTEDLPEVYEDTQLNKLFAACTAVEKVWYSFFLMTGMREQEVTHTYWSDVNLSNRTVRVKHKPDFKWTPKAYKEREIPIHEKLVKLLRQYKRKNRDCPLLFPTSGCRPKLDFLDCLKAVAKRAGLTPEDCYLHKFRATYATRSLWAGIDLRTVQAWMGHSDMESTMRYLRPARHEQVRAKVAAIF
jgi:integrase/recombinase XerD